MTAFPEDWPDGCPPDNASAPDTFVHRVVKTSPPTEDDFLTYREMGKPDNGRPCDAAALSVFTSKKDAQHYMEKYPYLGEFVAKGKLDSTHGKFAPTPRKVRGRVLSHASWWAYVNVDRCALFVVE